MNATPRAAVDGVLLLDKPLGITSNDALVCVRRLLNARKAGHGGTLDPMASGLLPVAFGEATKFAHDALDADKAYLARMALGVVTASGDTEGEVLERRPVDADEAAIRSACARFVGRIGQVPPMHSALKRDGRPLYEYARAGIEVEREPREVTVHSIEVLAVAPVPGAAPGAPGSVEVDFRVACSKGTYVRTLAEDIGRELGCGAHLTALRRERVGALCLQGAVTIAQLEAMSPLERLARLQPVDRMIAALPAIELDVAFAQRFLHGQRLRVGPPGDPHAARVRVYRGARLLGTGLLEHGLLVPQRLIDTGPAARGAAAAT